MGGLCSTDAESLPTFSEQQSTSTNPAWVSAAGKRLYEEAASLAESPYPQYEGARIATFGGGNKLTAKEREGLGILSGASAGEYRNFFDTAYGSAKGLGGGYQGLSSQELIGAPIDPGSRQGASTAGLLGSYQGQSQGDLVGSYQGQSQDQLLGSYQGMSQGNLVGGPTDAGQFRLDDSAKEYLDMYQRASDPAIREIDRTTQRRQMEQQAQAAQQGAFGGSRAAIRDVTADYEGANAAADVRSQAARQGLEFASGQYERDRGARLSASEADRRARFQAEGLGQSRFDSDRAARFQAEGLGQSRFDSDRAARFQAEGLGQSRFDSDRAARFQAENVEQSRFEADRAARLGVAASDREARFGAEEALRSRYDLNEASRLQASQQLAGYAPMLQGLKEQQASGLLAAGEAERQLDQRSLDLAYADYVEQREYPFAMTNFALGALQGVPYDTKTYSLAQGNQYIQSPSIYGQTIAGLGSLYSAYKLAQ